MPFSTHHYEVAFERYLRSRRIPYVAVDEARRALLPTEHSFRVSVQDSIPGSCPESTHALKSFDYVIYGQGCNLLVELKGRRVTRPPRSSTSKPFEPLFQAPRPLRSRLQSWVGIDDVESLKLWQQLFGPEFKAAFVFIYWCDEQPPDGLFQETFDHDGCWYAVRTAFLDDYARAMRTRSPRWRTVHVLTDDFERISHPLTPTLQQLGAAPPGAEPLYAPS